MAKILLSDPLAAISGRTSSDDKAVFCTRNGRTHTYVIKHHNPTSKRPLSSNDVPTYDSRRTWAE